MSKRKKRPQTRDADGGEPSSARSESPGEVSVRYPKTESARAQMGSDEEDPDSGGPEESEAKESQIQILPLWAWGVVMIISFLIAFWLVSTYVLGAP